MRIRAAAAAGQEASGAGDPSGRQINLIVWQIKPETTAELAAEEASGSRDPSRRPLIVWQIKPETTAELCCRQQRFHSRSQRAIALCSASGLVAQ